MNQIMLNDVQKNTVEFLKTIGYFVTQLTDNVSAISADDKSTILVHKTETEIRFQLEMGTFNCIIKTCDAEQAKLLMFQLLDLNTNILPVSIGLDTTDSEAPMLVIVESREIENMDSTEISSVIDAMYSAESAVDEVVEEFVS